jgi:hypothetical protein
MRSIGQGRAFCGIRSANVLDDDRERRDYNISNDDEYVESVSLAVLSLHYTSNNAQILRLRLLPSLWHSDRYASWQESRLRRYPDAVDVPTAVNRRGE